MTTFKPNLISMAFISSGIAMSIPALAQQAPQDENAEVIEVRGVRTSIINALDSKRNADTIGDFVGSGELGVLPDPSIADALGRVPGVTTVRDSGQSSQLNIRGMNGDFIQTTLNGREQASTSSYSEGSRWMAFDQFPAELITSAAVYKSPKASLIEGGVAGTVELQTVNPLQAQKKHNFSASGRLSYNDLAGDVGADELGSRFSLSYQGKFFDDTLGVAVGIANLKQPKSFESARTGADDNNGYTSAAAVVRPSSIQLQAGTGEDDRTGMLGTIVYRPNDDVKLQFDYFRSEYDSTDTRHGITASGLGTAIDNFDFTTGETVSREFADNDGVAVTKDVVSAGTVVVTNPTITNEGTPWFEARSEDQSTSSTSDSYGLNLAWQVSDNFAAEVDISHSKGVKTRKDRLASMHHYEFGTATSADGETRNTWQESPDQTLAYQLNGEGVPTLNFSTDFTDVNSMYLSRYEEYPHEYTDEIDSVALDFEYAIDGDFFTTVEFGYRSSERVFGAERGAFLYGSRDGQVQNLDADGNWTNYCKNNTSNPALDCMPHSVADFAKISSVSGGPDHIEVNLNGLADSIFGPGNYQGIKLFEEDWTFIESGDIKEKTDALYFVANFYTEIGDIPVSGNFGVRRVESDVKAIGLQRVQPDGSGTSITDGVGVTSTNYDYLNYGPEYTDTLPSLNLNFEISDEDVVRVAAAKVMGRPPVGKLKGGAGTWFGATNPDTGEWDTSYFSAWSKGTPYLDPFRATQYDISYEHYYEDGGAFTVAAFYKDISALVVAQNLYAQFGDEWPNGGAGFDIPIDPNTGEEYKLGRFETFVNGPGGYIRGIELASTQTFEDLPGIWSGLGYTASYSYTESETEITGGKLFPSQKLPIQGLSKNVWSVTLFWDNDVFSTHMNIRHRDEFIRDMPIPGSSTPVLAQPYTTVDYQASYKYDDNFNFVFQVNNLTDEANVESYGVDGLLGEYKSFGRQYYLGVNYSY